MKFRLGAAAFTCALAVCAGDAGRAMADDWIIGPAQAAQPAPDRPAPRILEFAIPAQTLETALERYGAATGLQILYDSRLAANRRSSAVLGSFDTDTALDDLLHGTGLAPVYTAHNVVTLVLTADAIPYAQTPPIAAPTLPLGPLHVDAPPAERHTLYATTVRFAVQTALQGNSEVREGRFRIDINVWLSPSGAVQRIEILGGTGDVGIDTAIVKAIRRVVIGQAPPRDLPQPVHVNIIAQNMG